MTPACSLIQPQCETADYSLVIVGAGLIGSAAARHAALGAAPGSRIALVGPSEPQGRQPGEWGVFGAHHDEGRITRCTDPDPTWALLAQRSIDRYAEIEEQSGVQFFSEVGHLAVGPAGAPSLVARAANAAAQGVPHELLDAAALRERYPYLSFPAGAAGVWEPRRSGHISARRLVAAQISAAQRCVRPGVAFERVDESAVAVEEAAAKAAAGTDQATGEAEGEAPAPSYRVLLRDGRELRAARVLLCCGAFTNGPSRLVPAPLRLSNFTTQTVHFSLGDGDAARLEGMPSVIAKFPTWWAYLLPPIRYPDGRTVLKLGGARVEDASAPAARLDAAGRTPGRGGTRPLPEPSDLLTWYRSGGDAAARCEMEGMLHELVPGLQPLEVRSDACANCRTETGLPLVGKVRGQLYAAAGGNGLAAKSSDEIGRLAALAALGSLCCGEGGLQRWQEPDYESELLARERFAPC